MAVLDLDGITQVVRNYQTDLRFLPYAILVATLVEQHKISLLPGVENEDIVTTFLRKGGIAKPLSAGQTIEDSELGEFEESLLKIENAYASVEDDLQNYKEKRIIRPGENIGINQSYKHPVALQHVLNIVKTFSEDLLDASFNAVRDTSDHSPMGLYDGFETKVEKAIVAHKISGGNGNILDSGTLNAPTTSSDITAYTHLRDWLRKADPNLLKDAVLLLPRLIAQNCMDAFKNKTASKAATFIDFSEYLSDDVDGNLTIVKSRIMGTGDRIYLTSPGNMEFGFNSLGDTNFVLVRQINKNPSIINYWLQGGFGTRWLSFHPKKFFTNTGSLTANHLSGDYS
jgi:hypothetical protein